MLRGVRRCVIHPWISLRPASVARVHTACVDLHRKLRTRTCARAPCDQVHQEEPWANPDVGAWPFQVGPDMARHHVSPGFSLTWPDRDDMLCFTKARSSGTRRVRLANGSRPLFLLQSVYRAVSKMSQTPVW